MRQVIGPRIPRSWLDDIEDASQDSAVPVGDWYTRDIFDKPGRADVVDDEYYCRLACVAVLMGEKSAVTAIQEAHLRILLRAGVWQAHELIGGGGSRLEGDMLTDVYIDDLIVLCCTNEICAPVELTARLAMADAAYAELSLPVKTEKGDEGTLTSHLLGAELRGGEGVLGSPLEKRIDLMAISLAAIRAPVSKSAFHQFL